MEVQSGIALAGGLPQFAQVPPQPAPGLIPFRQFRHQRLVASVIIQ